MADLPSSALRIASTLFDDGRLELQLVDAPVAAPEADQVVVLIEAAPINPSDLMVLIPSGDPAQARFEGTAEQPKVTLHLSPEATRTRAGRFGVPLGAGVEAAGVVVAAGASAQHLLGKIVAVMSLVEGTYRQYCTVAATACVPLPEGVSAAQGAGLFVNPMTALAMVETVRLEGHEALVHTAAASSLGQMLVKICREDAMPLVNIVRREEQAELLRGLGAVHVCNSSAPDFREQLVRAIDATRATIAFDAIGGGTMAGQILAAMEEAAAARLADYSPYGSYERKQVYSYGRLDPSPTQLSPGDYGLVWSLSGWLMPAIMQRVGPERAAALHERVHAGLNSIFAIPYSRTVSLAEALRKDVMLAYMRQSTGEKYLIDPSL